MSMTISDLPLKKGTEMGRCLTKAYQGFIEAARVWHRDKHGTIAVETDNYILVSKPRSSGVIVSIHTTTFELSKKVKKNIVMYLSGIDAYYEFNPFDIENDRAYPNKSNLNKTYDNKRLDRDGDVEMTNFSLKVCIGKKKMDLDKILKDKNEEKEKMSEYLSGKLSI